MKTYQRTSDIILKTALSFFGSLDNLDLLEDELKRKDLITIPQYANYLSQIAFTIELGMKTILLNEEAIFAVHDLELLYKKMPKGFRIMFEKTSFSKQTIDSYLGKIKNIYIEFRYMITDNIEIFLENTVDKQEKVKYTKVLENKGFQFIKRLLEEVVELQKSIYKFVDFSLLDEYTDKETSNRMLETIFEELNKIQTSLCVIETGE